MIASEGPPVSNEVANSAPIIDTSAPELGQPSDVSVPGSGVPPGAMTAQDILLSKLFWPWKDMGAQNIPERWLYMSPYVQGVIAQLAVQTPTGPKLVNADSSGRIVSGEYYDRNAQSINLFFNGTFAPHLGRTDATYVVPANRRAAIEMMAFHMLRYAAASVAGYAFAGCNIHISGVDSNTIVNLFDATLGAKDSIFMGHSGFLAAGDSVSLIDGDASTGGQITEDLYVRLTEFDA